MDARVREINVHNSVSVSVYWASFIFLAVVAGSVLILTFLPEGSEVSHSDLWPGKLGFTDTPDKVVFLFWMITLASGWLLALTVKNGGTLLTSRTPSPLYFGVVLAAIISIYISMVLPDEALDFWQGIPVGILIVIQALTVLLVIVVERGGIPRLFINLMAVFVAAIYLTSAGFQTASHVRDAYHSTIVLNDVLAPAAGQIPLGNAMATYTSLLGWPLKFVLDIFQLNPTDTGIWYLLALQLVTILVAVSLVLNRKTLPRWGLVILVAVSWIVLDPNQSGQTALQSLAISPARLFLPFVTIFIFLRVYSAKSSLRTKRILLAALGALAMLSAINNMEFGITIWAATLVFLIFVPVPHVSAWIRVLIFGLGSALALLMLVVLMALSGVSLHLDWLIRVPLIYAVAGIDLLAMPTIGVHLYVAALFIAASVAGLLIVRRSTPGSYEMYFGLLIGIVGTWSALSLTYFTGRSASAALISGYGLQVGVVSAALAGYVTIRYKGLHFSRESLTKVISIIFVTLPVAISLSLYVIGTDPRSTLAYGLVAEPVQQEYGFEFSGSESAVESDFYKALESGSVGQTVYPANIRALDTGISSVAKSPELFLSVSRGMGRFECQSNHNATYWIVPEDLGEKLLTIDECASVWSPTGMVGRTQDGKSIAVLQRETSTLN